MLPDRCTTADVFEDCTSDHRAALKFLRSLYDDANMVAVLWDHEDALYGSYWSATALIEIRQGVLTDYAAVVDGTRYTTPTTIYEATCAWRLESHPLDAPRFKQYDYDPLGDVFVWGRIVETHRVGGYEIVEYVPDQAANESDEDYAADRDRHPTSFHPVIDGRDSGHSYDTLDRALVACVVWRAEMRRGGINAALNERATGYIMRMLGGDDA